MGEEIACWAVLAAWEAGNCEGYGTFRRRFLYRCARGVAKLAE
jgi:hypothetical protein